MSNLPVMSHIERMTKRDFKQSSVNCFLSNFETFTTVSIVALLLNTSPSSARRTLKQLVRSGMLVEDKDVFVEGKKMSLFGISQAGLVAADSDPKAPYFERGRVSSFFINHKIEGQRIRILSEKIGGEWLSERQIRIQNPGLKKIPDALCKLRLTDHNLAGDTLMIEIEREVKTAKRYSEIVKNHLFNIEADEFADAVLYLFPKRYITGATRLLKSIPQPLCANRDNLANHRKYRFLIGSLESFPQDIHYLMTGEPVNFTPLLGGYPAELFE